MTRTFVRLCTPLLVGLLSACNVPDPGGDSDSDSSSGSDSDSAGEDPALGAHASDACTAAVARWADLTNATDLTAAGAAYEGPLQEYIRASDTITERSDDAAIVAALAGDQVSAIQPMIEVAMIARVRTELVGPETLVEDPYASWDEAYCLWDGALRDLALAAEIAGTSHDSDIVATIDAAFTEGHTAIDGEPPAATIDDWIVPPARQQIEKNLFRVLHRLIISAAENGDAPPQARRALEHFQGLEDRLEGRNTPGIAIIEGMLEDTSTLDVAELRRQLNIAFAKRTRKYCSDAIESSSLGTPTGYKGALEGRTYQGLITPDMEATLGADFDVADYIATWDAWVAATEAGDDADKAAELSEGLIEWNCAYQLALGIAECTASEDEPGA